MGKVIELASRNPPDYLEVDRHFAKAAAFSKRKRRTFSALIFANYAHAGVREHDSLARLRLAIAGLALEQFREEQGRLTDTLNDLEPRFLTELPQDPFTGAELRYRRLPKGYVIYSVGRDLIDDGGKEPTPGQLSRGDSGYDLTLTVER